MGGLVVVVLRPGGSRTSTGAAMTTLLPWDRTSTRAGGASRGVTGRASVVATLPGRRTTGRTSLPGFKSSVTTIVVFIATTAVSTRSIIIVGASGPAFNCAGSCTTSNSSRSPTGEFLHELLIFPIDRITGSRTARFASPPVVVPPVGTPLSVWTVSCHVPGIPADTADDVCSEVSLLGTVVLSMTNLPTVLASLVLIITEGAVQCCKLTELVAL